MKNLLVAGAAITDDHLERLEKLMDYWEGDEVRDFLRHAHTVISHIV